MQHLVHLWSMSIELVIKEVRQQEVRDLFTVMCVITDARAISAKQAKLGRLFIIVVIAQIMSDCGGRGGVPCSCEWCDQTLDQSSSGTSQMTRGPVVVHQNQQGDVTEWVISVCQSSVSGDLGSNACTIIAVLVAVNFLLPTGWILPCPQNNLPQAFTRMFKELMIQGNIVHQWLGHSQQTYSAPEIIQHPLLGFSGVARCGDEYQFTSFQQFSTELESIIINSG